MLKDFLFTERANRRSSLGRMVNQSTMLLMVSIGALILLFALLILFHQYSNATKGYLLRNLERERSYLLLEQEVLNMQIAKAQSMEKIGNDRQVQTMIPVKNPKYSMAEDTESGESID